MIKYIYQSVPIECVSAIRTSNHNLQFILCAFNIRAEKKCVIAQILLTAVSVVPEELPVTRYSHIVVEVAHCRKTD